MTTIKERILQIADYYNISYEKFFSDYGMSYSSFKGGAKKTQIGSNFIVTLLTNYPTINAVWLLLGEGEMFTSPVENKEEGNVIYERLISQLEKRISDKDEVINALKAQIELLKSQKKIIVPPVDDAASAVASGFSDK